MKNDKEVSRRRGLGVRCLVTEMAEPMMVVEDREGGKRSRGRPLFEMGSMEGLTTKEEGTTT